jgi:tRNA1(Val) A37 N6-methylase TrmN6
VIFADSDLSCDGFLDGRLTILQPLQGYRAATDPVFLAAAVPARAGQSVLELGCGAGVAALCLGARIDRLAITGVEIQPEYAELARRNAIANGQNMRVVEGDLVALSDDLRAQSFDHVMINPPYLARDSGTAAQNSGRERAFREETPLVDWINTALRRLKPKGTLSLIHLAERLPEILGCLNRHAGDIAVKPLSSRQGKPARRVIVRARKSSNGPFCLHSPLIIHDGIAHDGDRDSATVTARHILRGGGALEF